MKSFLKMTLATLTGLLLFGFVVTSILGGIIGGLASLSKSQPFMPASAVLTLDMSTIALSEQTVEVDPITMIQGKGTDIQPLGIYSAIQAINTAAEPMFQHCDRLLLEPTVGTMTDAECYLMKNDNWMLLVLKTGSVTFDETEGIIKANINTGLPDGQVFFVPIISSDNKSSDNGNLYFHGTIEDGTLTISRNGETDTSTGSSETFTKVFILLNT